MKFQVDFRESNQTIQAGLKDVSASLSVKLDKRIKPLKLQVDFSDTESELAADFADITAGLPIQFDSLHDIPADHYDGSYQVTPRVYEQTLPTAQKMMDRNIVVLEIPYAPVANIYGGVTVTIGGE